LFPKRVILFPKRVIQLGWAAVLVLALDTSSAAVTAGIMAVSDTQLAPVAERTELNPRGHSELLTPNITGCLDDAGARPADIDAIVAGTGPGPFTGLRVGLVTAAALADTLGIPAYGVCSLDAIGDLARDEPELLVVTDARRKEVYWARYTHGARTDGPHVSKPADVLFDGVTALAGAANEMYLDVWPDMPPTGSGAPPPVRRSPRCTCAARMPSSPARRSP
jgi:tRNA threonylcarbamoyl adenosine modification protein YeaZ